MTSSLWQNDVIIYKVKIGLFEMRQVCADLIIGDRSTVH